MDRLHRFLAAPNRLPSNVQSSVWNADYPTKLIQQGGVLPSRFFFAPILEDLEFFAAAILESNKLKLVQKNCRDSSAIVAGLLDANG